MSRTDTATPRVLLETERNQLCAVRAHYGQLSFQHRDAVRRIAEIDAEFARRDAFRENLRAACARLGAEFRDETGGAL